MSKNWREDFFNHFKDRSMCDEEKRYIEYAWKRISFTASLASSYIKQRSAFNSEIAVLDIGPSFLTEEIRIQNPNIIINTLGFRDDRLRKETNVNKHFQFDLNDTYSKANWKQFDKHDVIVMGEVIEHLYTAPETVLSFLKTMLKPNGYLIITNPNPVNLWRRIKVLFGHNPVEMIRENRENPGHFREYSRKELIDIGQRMGFRIDKSFLRNDVDFGKFSANFFYEFTGLYPEFRIVIYVVYQSQ